MNTKIALSVFYRHQRRFVYLLAGLVTFAAIGLSPSGTGATDRYASARITGRPSLQTPAPTGRIVVHFAPSAQLVMANGGLTARTADKTEHVRRIEDIVAGLVPGGKLEKRFPSAATNLDKSYAPSLDRPDLALYAHLETGTRDRDVLLRLLAVLSADPSIDLAFLEPVAVPAALGFDAFTGATPELFDRRQPTGTAASAAATDGRDTPNFENYQGYLADSPDGIGAWSMRSQSGARGAGVTVIDIEGAWLWAHEDLPDPTVDMGEHYDNVAWRYHGTAVIGEIRGMDNGLGVTGIVPDCAVGNSSIFPNSTAQALAAAMDTLNTGDLILIELHSPGPNADGNGQFGYLPMEWWQDNFDVIQLATAKGIIVVEASGNGYQNLDDAVYQNLFDRSVRDSGAIMCGATAGSSLAWADFSNYGSRVDLNGWGWSVVTCSYGDLQGDPHPEEEWYTGEFSGTSSASPIATGAVASLQGMVRARHGFDLDARLARDLLQETGTGTDAGRWIGLRPDLVAAYALADTGIGELTGTVTEAGTGMPLAGVWVKVIDQGGPVDGSFTATAGDGTWRLPLRNGSATVQFAEFYHEPVSTSATVTGGQQTVLNVSLNALPLIDIVGTVYGEGQRLAGARITPLVNPIPSAISDGSGNWTLADIPSLHTYQLLIDGVSGYGARVLEIEITGAGDPIVVKPVLAAISEDFETGDGGFTTTTGIWQRGTPPADVTGDAFSGSQCWGVGLGGSYDDEASDNLLSPFYDLSGVSADNYYLSLHYFSATEPSYDGVAVEIATGGAFSVIEPLGGYPDLTIYALDNRPGWSGRSGTWQGAVFDLTPYLGQPLVSLQFLFAADGAVNAEGFYIDGITFDQGLSVSAIDIEALPLPAAQLSARPNPFNPRVLLDYSLTRPARLDVRVYDVRGRLVRTLLSAPVRDLKGSLVWDGTDTAGHSAPSGVYLVRLRSSAGDLATQRIVLAR